MAVGLELARPEVRTEHASIPITVGGSAAVNAPELGSSHLGLAQLHRTPKVHAMHGENILRKIDTGRNNGHGPSPSE